MARLPSVLQNDAFNLQYQSKFGHTNLYSRAGPQNTNLETLFRLKKRRQAYKVKAKWKMTTNAEEK